jgi:Zn-dependent protease with chaperone function
MVKGIHMRRGRCTLLSCRTHRAQIFVLVPDPVPRFTARRPASVQKPAAFGFSAGNIALAVLLFGLLSALATFWFSPIGHWWSRRYEYEADAYARNIMSEASSLIGALRNLNEKNLSNLIPHPLYSRFYYSHPTLVEREAALTDASCSLR